MNEISLFNFGKNIEITKVTQCSTSCNLLNFIILMMIVWALVTNYNNIINN